MEGWHLQAPRCVTSRRYSFEGFGFVIPSLSPPVLCSSTNRRLAQPKKNGGPPYTFWGIVSMLYALLALPTVYALRRLPAAEVRKQATHASHHARFSIGLFDSEKQATCGVQGCPRDLCHKRACGGGFVATFESWWAAPCIWRDEMHHPSALAAVSWFSRRGRRSFHATAVAGNHVPSLSDSSSDSRG